MRHDVRYWHLAAIPEPAINVRFWGQSGHYLLRCKCPLLTQDIGLIKSVYLAFGFWTGLSSFVLAWRAKPLGALLSGEFTSCLFFRLIF